MKAVESMDAVLRARHDALLVEFVCASTELRVVKTPTGSTHTRTIDPFCTEPRAALFATTLTNFEDCCASCLFLTRGSESTHERADSEAAPEHAAAAEGLMKDNSTREG